MPWLTVGRAAKYAGMRDMEFRDLVSGGYIRSIKVRNARGRLVDKVNTADVDAYYYRRTNFAKAWEGR